MVARQKRQDELRNSHAATHSGAINVIAKYGHNHSDIQQRRCRHTHAYINKERNTDKMRYGVKESGGEMKQTHNQQRKCCAATRLRRPFWYIANAGTAGEIQQRVMVPPTAAAKHSTAYATTRRMSHIGTPLWSQTARQTRHQHMSADRYT
ncbi:hypothetical protein AVEN_8027-1 [Araneus ventricosus]|uniref:Uncharacterized protein n=1 Tax=Araneus ventricosus TaxID=182803 RepID=A0A4Y2W4P2_ARAVE|nr:hypothetical protein AVEN_8027-1 [Araneus ventricosus]